MSRTLADYDAAYTWLRESQAIHGEVLLHSTAMFAIAAYVTDHFGPLSAPPEELRLWEDRRHLANLTARDARRDG